MEGLHSQRGNERSNGVWGETLPGEEASGKKSKVGALSTLALRNVPFALTEKGSSSGSPVPRLLTKSGPILATSSCHPAFLGLVKISSWYLTETGLSVVGRWGQLQGVPENGSL